ncbi:PucR family transcriptional regulator [Actinokineospora guangxiensis]|uniref:PucR family transcriptional regulator n=1 Tax=Actinokineospora guangxiensis TaxID=1490288 RepID=A0ABW0ETW5_9PSEU
MTDHTDVLAVGGIPLSGLLASRMPELVAEVIRAVLAEVGIYRSLPDEEIGGEITAVVEENLRMVAAMLRERRMPDLARLGASARRRAEEGVPLESVLSAYHIGAHTAWKTVTGVAGPDDFASVRATTDLLIEYLRAVVSTVSSAYVDELRTLSGHEQSERHSLLAALLGGASAEDAARRAGVRLPAAFTVLVLHVEPHPDEETSGVDPVVAGRRKVRRMRAELTRHGRALSMVDTAGGTVLLPADTGDSGHCRDAEDLVAALGRAAGVAVTAAAAHAGPDGVAGAAEQAREVLGVVRRTGRPPGLYRLRDVLLDYQLTRDTPATRELAGLLAPLDGELIRTLRAHLSTELNRRRTAGLLHVHPNTVDNRLRRVAALTGLDPSTPSHLALITAALALTG